MKLYIFDVGGVMVDGFDTAPAIAEHLAMSQAEFAQFARASGLDELQAGLIGSTEFWSRFSKASGREVSDDPLARFFTPSRRDDMYALVEELKTGARVVAGTNTLDSHYDIHSARGDYAVFHHVYASNKMGAVKPAPGFYHAILDAEGVYAENAVFIDDMEVNVAAAKELGIRGVHFKSVAELKSELAGLAAASRGA